MDPISILVVAFLVGVLIGMTGMGGGSVMTPALIFLGINPTVAVANDLVASAFNRSAGAITHWKSDHANMKLAMWLIIGSVPFAFAGSFIVDNVGTVAQQQTFVKIALGVALLLAAVTYTLKVFITYYKNPSGKQSDQPAKIKPLPTLLIGAVGGLLVGMTSVGSGSIIMVALLLLYPTMKASGLVGTDLVQAVPLVIAAAIGHIITGGVQLNILLPLIIGSVPGTIVGARLAGQVPQKVLRRAIVIILLLSGLALLGLPPAIMLMVGLLALIFGPIVLSFPSELKKRRTTIDSNDSF